MLTERQWSWIRAVLAPILILAWFGVIFVVGMALDRVLREVIVVVVAGVIAYAITPLVSLLVRLVPWLPRTLAIAIAYLLGFLAIAALLGLVGFTAVTQIEQLVVHVPGYFNRAQELEPRVLAFLKPFGIGNQQLEDARNSLIGDIRGAATAIATGAINTVSTVAGVVVDAFVALILSVYLTANGPRIARNLRNAGAGVGWGRRVSGFITVFNQVLGGYVRGTLLLALMVGVLVTLLMLVLRVPYAVLLGVIAFFMEFIPVFGVFISGAICVLLALGTMGWVTALIALAGFVVLHFIEGELVGPRIMGKAVGIHPAVSLMALIVGTELFGIWGALLGAPAAGLLQALVIAGWREFRRSDLVEPHHPEPGEPRRHKAPPREDPLALAGEAASRERAEAARKGG